MERILYATIFLSCFNISQSLDIKKINKNRVRHGIMRQGDLFDVSEDGIRPRHQWKRPSGNKLTDWRRAYEDSSIEKTKYQDEFSELYKQKKEEAFDTETPKTDVVNMVAARPWGVPCGDPNQHDMPWGSCMRPEECAPEYRVHRGDYFCGRTTFVCCALQLDDYDPFGPLDASFDGSDFEVPLAEKLAHKPQHQRKKKSRYHEENRRLREEERRKRKKRMKKIIQRIVREIKKTFKNESRIRKVKTRQFKKFLKHLKRKYDKSRILVRDQHRESLNRTDREGEENLKQIYEMNKQFIRDVTDWNRVTTEPLTNVTENVEEKEEEEKEDPSLIDEDGAEASPEDDKTESSRRRKHRRSAYRDLYVNYDFYG